jgi:tetrapyrrole methylase family protein/MazG family protein
VLDALVAEARLRWGLDLAAGLQVIAAERLVATPIEPSRPVLVVPLATLRAAGDGAAEPLPGRHGPAGRDPAAILRRLYPEDHPVGRFGVASSGTVGELVGDDLGGPFYLAPLAPELAVASPWAMPWISARLRLPDGCPWDREQTHESLRNHLLEEAYEVYDALGAGATPALADELGDLLLQVILHAQLAAEEGVFDLTDVNAAIAAKIVRRHPHVFGDAEARTASDVNRQWERIKADERAAAAGSQTGTAAAADTDGEGAAAAAAGSESDVAAAPAREPKGALDGVSRILPALAASQEMQERAANIGYEWPSLDGVLDKVTEEVGELGEASSEAERAEEYGDLLFVLVNVARWHGIEAEAALRAANDKFRRRFRSVERQAAGRGVALRDLDFAALDALWDAAKLEERGAGLAAAIDKESPR